MAAPPTPDITLTTVGDWIKVNIAAKAITVSLRREDIRQPYSYNGLVSVPLRELVIVVNDRIDLAPASQSIVIDGTSYAAGTAPDTILDAVLRLLRNTAYAPPSPSV